MCILGVGRGQASRDGSHERPNGPPGGLLRGPVTGPCARPSATDVPGRRRAACRPPGPEMHTRRSRRRPRLAGRVLREAAPRAVSSIGCLRRRVMRRCASWALGAIKVWRRDPRAPTGPPGGILRGLVTGPCARPLATDVPGRRPRGLPLTRPRIAHQAITALRNAHASGPASSTASSERTLDVAAVRHPSCACSCIGRWWHHRAPPDTEG